MISMWVLFVVFEKITNFQNEKKRILKINNMEIRIYFKLARVSCFGINKSGPMSEVLTNSVTTDLIELSKNIAIVFKTHR